MYKNSKQFPKDMSKRKHSFLYGIGIGIGTVVIVSILLIRLGVLGFSIGSRSPEQDNLILTDTLDDYSANGSQFGPEIFYTGFDCFEIEQGSKTATIPLQNSEKNTCNMKAVVMISLLPEEWITIYESPLIPPGYSVVNCDISRSDFDLGTYCGKVLLTPTLDDGSSMLPMVFNVSISVTNGGVNEKKQ